MSSKAKKEFEDVQKSAFGVNQPFCTSIAQESFSIKCVVSTRASTASPILSL